MRAHRSIATASLLAALLAACSAELSVDEAVERQAGQIGPAAALGQAELNTYLSDRQYMRALAPAGKAVRLNHADPRQHRFAMMRLRLAGQTPERSPQLFADMDALRAGDIARGLRPGSVETLAAAEVQPAGQHTLMTTGSTSTSVLSTALASRAERSRGFLDSSTYDDLGNAIGDYRYVEVFGTRRYVVVQSTGDLARTEHSGVLSDSFLSETLIDTGERQQSYIVSEPLTISTVNALDVPTIEHPRDSAGNGASVICLERPGAGECEYTDLRQRTLRVPLKGSISVTGDGVTIDQALIRNTYQSPDGPSPGSIYVTLGIRGGGCTVPARTMSSFWKHVTVSPAGHPTTLSWDLYTDPATWAELDPPCRLLQDTAFVTLDLVVPYMNTITGTTGTLPVTISNVPLPTPLLAPNLSFAPALRFAAGEASCGDGIEDEVEGCDDGNLVDGDGCSARCQLELPAPPRDAVPDPTTPSSPAKDSGGCRAGGSTGSAGLALVLMLWRVGEGVTRRARRSRRRSR